MRIALAVLRRDRRSQVATVLVALGVMIAVSLVLWLLAAPNGLQARADRTAWRDGASQGDKGTISVAASQDSYDGKLIERFDVARTEQGAVPVAAGIARFPEAGEVLLSPALADLVRTTPPEKLGNRFPGRQIAELGPEALKFPGELVAIVGHEKVENGWPAADLRGGAGSYRDDYHGMLYLLTRVGLVVLVVPCLVLVASAARLTAAKRERRLAALRLAGASPRQVVVMTAVETAIGAVVGSVLGVVLARPFSHLTAKVPWEGGTWYPGDFVPEPAVVAAVAVLAPLLVIGAAITGLRRVVNQPLAAEAKRGVRSWRLLTIAGALGVFFLGVMYAQQAGGDGQFTVVLLGLGAVALALVLAGPVLTAWVGRFFVGRWRRPSTLLAGRRLAGDPVAAFRGSAGVVIAVFTGSMALTMLPGLESQVPYRDSTWLENAIVAEQVTHDVTPLRLALSGPIVTMLDGTINSGGSGPYVVVGECADIAKVLTGLQCRPGPAVYAPGPLQGNEFESSGSKDPVTARLPASYETRPFEGSGRVSAVIDRGLLPSLTGEVSMVGVPTTPENRDAVHTALIGTLPGVRLVDGEQRGLFGDTLMADLQRATIIGLSIAAVLGGIGAAVSAAGSVIDRRRTFGALIAAGTPIRVLAHALRREVMLPVFAVTIAACGAGIVVGLGLLTLARGLVGHGEMPITPWVIAPVGVGVAVALVAALACGPVLRGISPRDYAAE
ncbi:FtsX-like permease family protein [Lentzea flaviverrucosa]|uniref:FtsX-like permease family protein n=1 Tax=Lentzea flaviverrucosa TaxID=200379 RepID=A0A1H9TU70_9PSEU|nr:FtsX-like permease family protein [Lentzea flaviverrucosa]RDI33473.1 FtsX-like permease family protein [Lentzea flaviverrucosa]SES00532.1 FtsX-like permease family protein [Lentzea flaviverrucosa]